MIRIAYADGDELARRCQVAPLSVLDGDEDYDRGAIVPAKAWQRVEASELERFRVLSTTPPGLVIELVSVPVERAQVRATPPELRTRKPLAESDSICG